MMHTRFRCRKLAKEHNYLCCRELPSAETHLIHCRVPYAPVMEHVHLNCGELVIHPFVLALASSAEHTHLDYLEQVVGIFTLTVNHFAYPRPIRISYMIPLAELTLAAMATIIYLLYSPISFFCSRHILTTRFFLACKGPFPARIASL